VNEPWWRTLLREQQGSGFRDVAGADAAMVLPVSDRLITAVVSSLLPASLPVRRLTITAEADDRFTVRVKLAAPALIPPITVRFAIVQQPQLPSPAELVCAPVSGGVGTLLDPLIRLFATLPPFIRWSGNQLRIDLQALAAHQGAAEYMRYVRELTLGTQPGRFVLTVRVTLPSGPSEPAGSD
jgi:hypothetical protein